MLLLMKLETTYFFMTLTQSSDGYTIQHLSNLKEKKRNCQLKPIAR